MEGEFKEYDVVSLAKPIAGAAIPIGALGTILMEYKNDPPAYEVEFISEDGKSLGVIMVTGDYLKIKRQ